MKYLFIFLSLFSYSISYAQFERDQIMESVEFRSLAEEDSLGLTSLYEFGQQITSCDCNFQNLFRNWTFQFISNIIDVQLVSCKYVGIIEDSIVLNRYAKKLTDKNVLRYRIEGNQAASVMNRYDSLMFVNEGFINRNRSFHIGTTQENIKVITKKDITLSQLNELYILPWKAAFFKKVHVGDHVYMITFNIRGKEYHNYAICGDQNHRVVWDSVFGFKDFISRITLID